MSTATLPAPAPLAPLVETPRCGFEFSIPYRIVLETLRALKPVVASRSTLPVLQTVHIERDGRLTRFTATDLDRTLCHTITAHEPEPSSMLGCKILEARHARERGSLCVNHAALSELLKSADGGEIIFRPHEIGLPVMGRIAGDSRCHGPSTEEFPPPPPFVPQTCFFLPDEIRAALIDSLPFVSADETRTVLNGALLDPAGTVVATDGRRAIVTTVPALSQLPTPIIIPTSALRLLASPALAKESLCEVFVDLPDASQEEVKTRDAMIRFDIGESPEPHAPRLWTLVSKLVDGNYPNYRQVIPQHSNCEIALSESVRVALIEAVQRLPRRHERDTHDGVNLLLSSGSHALPSLRISTTENAYTEQPVTITAAADKAPKQLRVCLQRGFLLDALKLGLKHIRFIDTLSSVVFADGPDTESKPARRKIIMMPLRSS